MVVIMFVLIAIEIAVLWALYETDKLNDKMLELNRKSIALNEEIIKNECELYDRLIKIKIECDKAMQENDYNNNKVVIRKIKELATGKID